LENSGKFKPGDRVRATASYSIVDELVEGQIYVVVESNDYTTKVEGHKAPWGNQCFEPVPARYVENLIKTSLLEEENANLRDQLAQVTADRDKTKRTVDKMTRERDISKEQLQGQKSYLQQELRAAEKEISALVKEAARLQERELAAEKKAEVIGQAGRAWQAYYEKLEEKMARDAAAYSAKIRRMHDRLELVMLERDEARDLNEKHEVTIHVLERDPYLD
jgi:chromosome segregation ATPase